jgi:hypothetical protein
MADGNPLAPAFALIDAQIADAEKRMPRIPTVDECFDTFREAAMERSTATVRDCVQEGLVIREMAAIIVEAHAKLAGCHKRLSEGRSVSETVGHGIVTRSAKMAPLDEVAVVEALFWETLTPEADALLNAEIRELVSDKPTDEDLEALLASRGMEDGNV